MKSVRKRSKKESNEVFAKNLSLLLKERNLSAAHAAKLIGVSTSTMHGWVSGTSPTDLAAVLRLSEVLHVDFQFLLTGVNARTERAILEGFDFEREPVLNGLFAIELRRLSPKKGGPR